MSFEKAVFYRKMGGTFKEGTLLFASLGLDIKTTRPQSHDMLPFQMPIHWLCHKTERRVDGMLQSQKAILHASAQAREATNGYRKGSEMPQFICAVARQPCVIVTIHRGIRQDNSFHPPSCAIVSRPHTERWVRNLSPFDSKSMRNDSRPSVQRGPSERFFSQVDWENNGNCKSCANSDGWI